MIPSVSWTHERGGINTAKSDFLKQVMEREDHVVARLLLARRRANAPQSFTWKGQFEVIRCFRAASQGRPLTPACAQTSTRSTHTLAASPVATLSPSPDARWPRDSPANRSSLSSRCVRARNLRWPAGGWAACDLAGARQAVHRRQRWAVRHGFLKATHTSLFQERAC